VSEPFLTLQLQACMQDLVTLREQTLDAGGSHDIEAAYGVEFERLTTPLATELDEWTIDQMMSLMSCAIGFVGRRVAQNQCEDEVCLHVLMAEVARHKRIIAQLIFEQMEEES
jgi:hypothetical protein